MKKTEYFETVVQQGFYGIHKGGLFGKKDNVRKYWEDISIKTAVRNPILNLLKNKTTLKIVDLGAGSGEGLELLTHIPSANNLNSQVDFIFNNEMIEKYLGLDISPAMVLQGKENYSDKSNIFFKECNLAEDLSLFREELFDIYFSSYSSPSHLTGAELTKLIEEIFISNNDKFLIALDVFGKFSPEWPIYWNSTEDELLNYNMSWIYEDGNTPQNEIESYSVRFWGANELQEIIKKISSKYSRSITMKCYDRSIFVGRHMQTGYFNKNAKKIRLEINKLFDRDYRGNVKDLFIDISYLQNLNKTFPEQILYLENYLNQWNMVIRFMEAMISGDNYNCDKLIDMSDENLKEELQMLKWLERNSSRFPVVDFWASVFGPQVACVLRNLEINLPDGIGCGHGLFCTIEVDN